MAPADPNTVRGRWLRYVYATARVPDSVRVLLLVMAEHMDEDGRVEIGRNDLATWLARSPQRISTRLSDATEARLLNQVRRGNRGAKSVFQALIPEGESVTPGGDMFPEKHVSISRPLSEETNHPRGEHVSEETDHPRGRRKASPSSPPGVTKTDAPIREGVREQPSQATSAALPEQPDAPSPVDHKRVTALARVYDRATNGMGNLTKIRAVVKKALNSGYSDEEIIRGLERVAADGRFALTADTLRIAINRSAPARPQLRVVGGHTPYRNPTDYGENPDPWS